MTKKAPSKIDQLLDLLLDALQERDAARGVEQPVTQIQPLRDRHDDDVPEPLPARLRTAKLDEQSDVDQEATRETADAGKQAVIEALDDEGEQAVIEAPERLPSIHLDRMLGRLVLALLALTVLINIPFNRYGNNLARAMPDRQALVIRDGLLLKSGGDEIYVLEDNHKRWISSLEAFEFYGFHWEQVNQVNGDFLDRFPDGPALSILNKCDGSPHIYAIENGVRRWIKDIPTFETQGYVWDDVQFVSCAELETIPSGPPIPPDAGEPPMP